MQEYILSGMKFYAQKILISNFFTDTLKETGPSTFEDSGPQETANDRFLGKFSLL